MSQNGIPRIAIRSTAFGVLLMSFFGTTWAGIGVGGLQGVGFPWPLILSLLIGTIVFISGFGLLKATKGLSNEMSKTDAYRSKRVGIWFGVIFGLEGVLIGAASAICDAMDHFNLFFPVMAFIVGIHFFPLARLFRVKIHYIAGGLICLLAMVTLFTVPENTIIGQQQILTWWVVVGFGSAIILWGTGVAIWFIGRKLLIKANIK